jgi:DNA end-binding protein Ku
VAGAFRWKGAVQFGPLIQFNVTAKSAVKAVEFRFNKHHAECGGRLAQGGMTCTACGQTDVQTDEIVRGYEGVSPVDEDYLEQMQREKSPVLELDGLVPQSQIDPRYFQKSYDVTPDKGSEKPYVLFLRLLEDLQRVAVGKVVMSGKEFIVVFRPHAGILAMEVLYWPEELVAGAEAEAAIEGVSISKKELALGRQLAEAMATDFDPTAYRNEFAIDMQTYLDGFVNGAQPTPITSKPRVSRAAQSLEDALAASLAQLPEKKPTKKRKTA